VRIPTDGRLSMGQKLRHCGTISTPGWTLAEGLRAVCADDLHLRIEGWRALSLCWSLFSVERREVASAAAQRPIGDGTCEISPALRRAWMIRRGKLERAVQRFAVNTPSGAR
jgi:hypothetical protein